MILPPLSKKQVLASLDFLMERMKEARKWVDKQGRMALEIPDPWEHFSNERGPEEAAYRLPPMMILVAT